MTVTKTRGSLADRLHRQLTPEAAPQHAQHLGPCLLWTGATNRKGYGLIQRGARGEGCLLTHRAAWEVANGPVADGLGVLHHCDVPACCRVDHLFVGTNGENNADMMEKGRYGVLPEHLPRGDDHRNAKLTDADVLTARRSHAGGTGIGTLAKRYNVAKSTMAAALAGKTWAHVPEARRG